MKILIVGAGNGGLAFATKLTQLGVTVNLYDKYEDVITPIVENGNIVTLKENGKCLEVKINLITSNLEEALSNINIIFVIAPAFNHEAIANELVDHLSNNHKIILHPGRTGGALIFKEILSRNGISSTVAEADTLLFACRKLNYTTINILGVKNNVGISALPNSETNTIVEILNKYLPYFKPRQSIIDTSLRNIGAIFHPTPFLFNINKIDQKTKFKFYHDGITPNIAKLLEDIDIERITIAKSYNLSIPTAREWLNLNYNLNGKTLYESIQQNDSYNEIYAPLETYPRYIFEDIPTGLVPMSYLARSSNIETPTIDAVIHFASIIFRKKFLLTGRTFDKMGLSKNSLF